MRKFTAFAVALVALALCVNDASAFGRKGSCGGGLFSRSKSSGGCSSCGGAQASGGCSSGFSGGYGYASGYTSGGGCSSCTSGITTTTTTVNSSSSFTATNGVTYYLQANGTYSDTPAVGGGLTVTGPNLMPKGKVIVEPAKVFPK